MKVASCSIVRLENAYIREFVEHQQKIGFDKVFIYDHNLPDGEHLEEVIDDYIQAGFVEVIDFREGHKMGPAVMEAFQHCWDNYKQDFDWMLFCDNDEFLTFTQDKTVKEYLSRECFKDVNIIKLNWLCYDDNDLLHYDNRPLNERFTRPCNEENMLLFRENKHIKCMINCKTDNIDLKNGSAHCPKMFSYYNVCYNNGVQEIAPKKNNTIPTPNFDLAYLKHFRMKTIEEYVLNKNKKLSNYGYDKIKFDLDLFFKYNFYSNKKERLYYKLIKRLNIKLLYKVTLCTYTPINNIDYYNNINDWIEYYYNLGFSKILIYNIFNLKLHINDEYKPFVKLVTPANDNKIGNTYIYCSKNLSKYNNLDFMTFLMLQHAIDRHFNLIYNYLYIANFNDLIKINYQYIQQYIDNSNDKDNETIIINNSNNVLYNTKYIDNYLNKLLIL